jgi:predicted enzyme related to lactoylglutathione lyase
LATVPPYRNLEEATVSEHSPDWRTGKICYLELPALDPDASAEFYATVFGWPIRRRGDGALAFDDTVGGVSGTFVTGREPAGGPGAVLYVMVADAAATRARITEAGGRIVQESPPDFPEVFAWFADPVGNVLGIYQQPGLAETERAR